MPATSVFAPKPEQMQTPRAPGTFPAAGAVRPTTTAPRPADGLQNIPTRTLRVPTQPQSNAQPPPAPNVDPAVQTVLIEVNRSNQPPDYPPLPPTELTGK